MQGAARQCNPSARETAMTRIERWTGALACLLQSATGMTNESFASWLGIAVRTVAYWHSRPDTVPGNSNQEILTAALDRVSDPVRDRFFRMVADSFKEPGIPRTGN